MVLTMDSNAEETYEQAMSRHSFKQHLENKRCLTPPLGTLALERIEQTATLRAVRARLAMNAEAQELERRKQLAELNKARFNFIQGVK
jgi:hypothetical protein